jgi:hypothetical protein
MAAASSFSSGISHFPPYFQNRGAKLNSTKAYSQAANCGDLKTSMQFFKWPPQAVEGVSGIYS